MPGKFSFLIVVLLLSSTASFSQKFMQGAGVTAHFVYGKTQTPYSSSSFFSTYSTFTYFPRYNVLETENTSLSIGLPFGAGVGIETELYGNDTRISFAYDVLPVLDYNIGCKSTRSNPKNFGGYIGAGFSYFQVFNSIQFRGSTYGPLVRGGVRFLFSKTRMAGNALNVGLFYKKGIEAAKVSTIGLMGIWDF